MRSSRQLTSWMKIGTERKERYFPAVFLMSVFPFLHFKFLISSLDRTLDSQLEFDIT